MAGLGRTTEWAVGSQWAEVTDLTDPELAGLEALEASKVSATINDVTQIGRFYDSPLWERPLMTSRK